MKSLFSIVFYSLAFSSIAQNDNTITVHEWGTFTARYTGFGQPYLDVQKTIDEPVPGFVHSIDFEKKINFRFEAKETYYYEACLINLMDVSIKMETPVLYFYSKKPINNLMVNVTFPQGSISELYPSPLHKEDENYIKTKCRLSENKFVPGTGPPVFLSFKNYNGYAAWKINILAPDDVSKPTEPDETVPHVWLAPRKTKANMIEANGEREKYIFYRGLGGFTNPVIPTYTKSGHIIVKNETGKNIPYTLVYERDADGKRFIWGENSKTGTEDKIFFKNKVEINNETWQSVYRKRFVKELVIAGLYEDEAEAMLNTWDKSYFGKPGIKVFWIVPRSFTDEILPINFSQPIASLERVMVGRTEIDPFIESKSNFYLDDPILIASNTESKYIIYPNPSVSGFYIKSSEQTPETISLEITDFSGRLISSCQMSLIPSAECKIPFENINNGIYFVKIKGNKNCSNFKISLQ